MAVAGYEYSELSENLEKLEQELLSYEKLISSGQESHESVHTIFRFAHNLKSALGMVHRYLSSHLIHSVETNFDKIRNGKSVPSMELIRVSLLALDLIKKNLLEDTEDAASLNETADILESISRNTNMLYEEKLLSALKWNWKSTESDMRKVSYENGAFFYMMEKNVSRSISREKFSSLPFFEDILKVGTIIKVCPGYDEITALSSKIKNPETVVRVLFSSSLIPDDLKKSLFDPFYPVLDDIDSNQCCEEPVKTILFSRGIQFNGLKIQYPALSGITVDSTDNPDEFLEKIRENPANYQLAMVDSDNEELNIRLLKGISEIEKNKKRIKRMVCTENQTSSSILNYFMHFSDCCIKPSEVSNKFNDEINRLFPDRRQ